VSVHIVHFMLCVLCFTCILFVFFDTVLHGNGNDKIPRDYGGKTAGTVIRTKSVTAVTAGTGTVRAVIPWERESNFVQRNIDSNDYR